MYLERHVLHTVILDLLKMNLFAVSNCYNNKLLTTFNVGRLFWASAIFECCSNTNVLTE